MFVLFRLFAYISKDTAINIENVSIDSVRSLRGKEYCGASEFAWVEPATCRCLGADE